MWLGGLTVACFSFILTEVCDWECNYCQFPLLNSPNELTTEKIIKHTPYIKEIISKTENPYVEMQGGEIGLIGSNMLALFLEELDQQIIVSTNGLFMERGYHLNERIRPYLREIMWHVCDKPGDYKLEVDYNDDDLFINKGIVHDDISNIVTFIRRNPHITFNYIELECDIRHKRSHHVEDYRRLYDHIVELSNVSNNALQIVKRRIDNPDSISDRCRKYHSVVSINLASETICLCQRVTDINVPLTRDNLIGRLKEFPNKFFEQRDSMGCASCIRLCCGKYEFDARETLKIRRLDFNES